MDRNRKVLFFIAGQEATADELGLIARIVGSVQIRSNLASATFGDKLEAAQALAGTIPAAYKTASGGTAIDLTKYPDGDVTPALDAKPEALKIISATGVYGLAAGTLNLRAVKADFNSETGEITVTDVTTACAWTSATPGVCTVGAATGVVTKVAAGTSNVTAALDYDGGGSLPTMNAVQQITVN